MAPASLVWDNNWHQVTGTYDGTNVSLYVDGNLVGTTVSVNTNSAIDYAPLVNNGDLLIGNLNPTVSGGNFFVGSLDEVKIFNVTMSASDVSDNFTNPNDTASTNGLIAWYKCEGNLNDSWGTHNGTLVNPAVATYKTSRSGQGLFSPKGVVQIPDNSDFEANNVTVQAWVQGVAPGTGQYIVTKAQQGISSYALYTGSAAGANFLVATGVTATSFVTSPTVQGPSIWDGAWHQLTGVYDGAAAHIYLDGIEAGAPGTPGSFTIPFSTNLASGNVLIGNYGGFTAAQQFSGFIDDVKIYDQALSPAAVLATFTDINLAGWWEGESNANDTLGLDNGTATAGVTYAAGRLTGKAFHTTGGAVVIPDSATLRPANVTVEAMVRAGPIGANKYVISKSFNGAGSSYALYSGASGGLAFYVSLSGGVTVSPAVDPSIIWDGNFHAVAGTYDGTNVNLYVDGVQVGGGTAGTGAIQYGATQSSGELLFGDFADTITSSNFNGVIDQVRLYGSGLSAATVAADAFRPIIITVPPANQVVTAGQNATFSVGQLGKTPLGYQWQFNGTNISGATNATLTVTNAQAANAGQYSVGITAAGVKFTTNSPFGVGQSFQLAQGTVTVPDSLSLDPVSLSLQAWVRLGTQPGTFKYIISKSQGAGVASYAFYTAAEGGLRFYIAETGAPGFLATDYAPGSNVWNGVWHQITGTFTDQGSIHLYLDGQEVGTGLDSFLSSILYTNGAFSPDLLFGDFSATSSANHYTGDLDDVKLFDHELSADDVLDTYTNPNGMTATNGLISWWKGDGNALDEEGLNPGVLPPPGFAQSGAATLTIKQPFALTNAKVVAGIFQATISGGSATNGVVQKSPDFVNWTPVVTNAVPFTFTDPINTNTKQFYRVLAQ
jgi:hypothetical protein